VDYSVTSTKPLGPSPQDTTQSRPPTLLPWLRAAPQQKCKTSPWEGRIFLENVRTSSFSSSSQLQTLPLSPTLTAPTFAGSTRAGKAQSTHSEEETPRKKKKNHNPPHATTINTKMFLGKTRHSAAEPAPRSGPARRPPTAGRPCCRRPRRPALPHGCRPPAQLREGSSRPRLERRRLPAPAGHRRPSLRPRQNWTEP